MVTDLPHFCCPTQNVMPFSKYIHSELYTTSSRPLDFFMCFVYSPTGWEWKSRERKEVTWCNPFAGDPLAKWFRYCFVFARSWVRILVATSGYENHKNPTTSASSVATVKVNYSLTNFLPGTICLYWPGMPGKVQRTSPSVFVCSESAAHGRASRGHFLCRIPLVIAVLLCVYCPFAYDVFFLSRNRNTLLEYESVSHE